MKTILLAAAILAANAGQARGQGTAADYDRARTLRERTADKVARSGVRPRWLNDDPNGRFWYRNDLPGGGREFVLVDPSKPSRQPAFDHATVASELSKALGTEVDPHHLPIERIAFDANGALRIQTGEKTFAVDSGAGTLTPSDEPMGRLEALHPLEAPPSANGGGTTEIVFVNRTGGDVALVWVDPAGGRREYARLRPDETQRQHTYARHVWLATRSDGEPIAAYVARDDSSLAVIDGTPARRERRRRGGPDSVLDGVSPDGRWKARIRDHNLVLVDTSSGEETPLTTDGEVGDAYGGPFHWSPDARRLVVMRTIPAEERKVTLVESSPADQVQPKIHVYDYLKPGDRIAHPRPCLFDIGKRAAIAVPDDLFANPWDITELKWDPDGRRFTFLYNQRGHQVLRLVAVDAETGAASAVIEERSDTFIDYSSKTYLHRLESTGEAIWMSERSGWNHLYLYDTRAGRVVNRITSGEWVVREVERVDEEKRQVWIRVAGIVPGQDPYYLHSARVNLDGSGFTLLTEGDGTHTTVPSPDGRFYVDTWSRVDMPPVSTLRRMSDGGKILDLESGDATDLLATGWRFPERFVAKGRDGKTDIYGVIYRPSTFNPAARYPVLESIYAGPQGQFVPKDFSPSASGQAMAELGFIVVQIDGMGTNWRSKAFHDVCWKNLADAGFPDRIAWMRAAAAKYPQFDLERVGLYGGSAGGQNALGGLLLHPDFYKAAAADCGCHDNRMDKIWWNEQWMGWPVGPEYAANSNVTLAPNLKGKLLLVVGELDTNVDPASTMQVVNALVKADKDFEMLVIPGAGHGAMGSPYGHRRMQDFFVRTLLGAEPRSGGSTP